MGGVPGETLNFKPDAVAALLAEHPRMLMVLDNVWSLSAIKPLLEAAGPVRVLITTRQTDVLRMAGEGGYKLGLLSAADALNMFKLRLGWQPTTPQERAWVNALIIGVGHHPLALDVALGLMTGQTGPADWQRTAEAVLHSIQHGDKRFSVHTEMPDSLDRDASVSAVLEVSYAALARAGQPAAAPEHLRALGAFALEAVFETAHVAAVWGCPEDEAQILLSRFFNLAVIESAGSGTWRMHALIRGDALNRLHVDGQHEVAHAAHASGYLAAMRAADDANAPFRMRAALPQLRHAFVWAIKNDLALALALVGNTANLHAAFGETQRENEHWARQGVEAASQRGSPSQRAQAQGSLGNALQRSATQPLPEQTRGQLLLQALAAYEAALEHYRPDTAPLDYAATQNNRATLLSAIASLPGEDRRARLLQALAAYEAALEHYRPDTAPLAYAATQNNRATLLSDIASLPGEDRRARLRLALGISLEAVLIFVDQQHTTYVQSGIQTAQTVISACGDDLESIVATAALAEPQHDVLRQLMQTKTPAVLKRMLEDYIQRSAEQADRESDVDFWQSLCKLGNDTLTFRSTHPEGVNWDALAASVAQNHNSLGNVLDDTQKVAQLAAFERACALQPHFAMYHRNRAGMLIELARLEDAALAIATARALEPGAARLEELEVELKEAHEKASGDQHG